MSGSYLFGSDAGENVAAAVFRNILELNARVEAAVPVDEYLLFAYLTKAWLIVLYGVYHHAELEYEYIRYRGYSAPLLSQKVAEAVGVFRSEKSVHYCGNLFHAELFQINDVVIQLWEAFLRVDELNERIRQIFQQQLQICIKNSRISSALGTFNAVVGHIYDDVFPVGAPFDEILVKESSVSRDDELLCIELFTVEFYGVFVEQGLSAEEVDNFRIVLTDYEIGDLVAGLAAETAVFRVKMPFIAIAAPEVAFVCYADSVVHDLIPVLSETL